MNGTTLEFVGLQPEAQSSTPLRNRSNGKTVSRIAREASPNLTPRRGVHATVERSGAIADLRRRAENVSSVLGVNVLHIEDVSVLQCKVIEVAERLLRVEEWYNEQLQERSAYVEHCMTQLAAATCQKPMLFTDGMIAPTTVRTRCGANGTTAKLSSSSLGFDSSSASRHATTVAIVTPVARAARSASSTTSKSSRNRLLHHRQHTASPVNAHIQSPVRDTSLRSPISSRRYSRPDKRQVNAGGGEGNNSTSSRDQVMGTRAERRKARTSSMILSRRSVESSEVGVEELVGDLQGGLKNRSTLGSSFLLSTPTGNATPKRLRPSSGRVGHLSHSRRRD